jgi:hypothetical protein
MRTALFILATLLVALCAAEKTQIFTGVILAGQSSVSIPYGVPLSGHGLIINAQANFSHTIMTTLEPRLARSVWNPASKLWESTSTATWCEVDSQPKQVNIIISCYTHDEATKCLTDVAYYIVVEEYNGTLQLWNPDHGALRWQVTLGGTGTSVMWNVSFDDANSSLLSKRSDLHFTIITADGSPSSAAAALYSFSSKDVDWESCDLSDRDEDDKGAFAGTNSLFLGKLSLSTKRQYTLVLNGTEPRNTYWLIAHVTPGLKRAANIWVFVAVAVACFIVGAILTGICTTFFWTNSHRDEDRQPLVR